jgi:hypothetical protein
MRAGWAAAWARHLKPGGLLITLQYPIDASMDPGAGPPWPLTPQLYNDLLLPAGAAGSGGGGGGQRVWERRRAGWSPRRAAAPLRFSTPAAAEARPSARPPFPRL